MQKHIHMLLQHVIRLWLKVEFCRIISELYSNKKGLFRMESPFYIIGTNHHLFG